METGRRHHHIGLQHLAALQLDPVGHEPLDHPGLHRRLAGLHLLEEIRVGHERDPLLPGPVFRGEVGGDHLFRALAERIAHQPEQLAPDLLRLVEAAAVEHFLLVEDLPPYDLVDPGLVDLEPAQFVGDLDRVAPGPVEDRRPLQHRDMRAVLGDVRHDGRGRRAGADHHDLLAGQIHALLPVHGMDDLALEILGAGPLRREPVLVPVVALTHPQEVRGEPDVLAGIGPDPLDRPALGLARPRRPQYLMLVADAPLEPVLGDHLAHVTPDFLGRRDRRASPGLEAIAERVEVAIRPDPGIFMGIPCSAIALLRLQHQEPCPRHGVLQVISGTDARYPGPDDQDIDVLRLGNTGFGAVDARRFAH